MRLLTTETMKAFVAYVITTISNDRNMH
jgi:hypothetical protein